MNDALLHSWQEAYDALLHIWQECMMRSTPAHLVGVYDLLQDLYVSHECMMHSSVAPLHCGGVTLFLSLRSASDTCSQVLNDMQEALEGAKDENLERGPGVQRLASEVPEVPTR